MRRHELLSCCPLSYVWSWICLSCYLCHTACAFAFCVRDSLLMLICWLCSSFTTYEKFQEEFGFFPHLILSEPWGNSQPFKDTPTTILRTTMGKRACVCESWYENCSIHHQPYKYKSSPFPIQDVSKDVVTMIQHFHVSHQKLLKIDHTHFRESKVLRAWLSSLAWTLSCTLEYIELYLLRRHLRMAGMRMLVFLHLIGVGVGLSIPSSPSRSMPSTPPSTSWSLSSDLRRLSNLRMRIVPSWRPSLRSMVS